MSSYGDVLPVCLWKFHQAIFAVLFFHPKTSQTPVARTGVIAMPDVVRIQQLESSGEVSHGFGMNASTQSKTSFIEWCSAHLWQVIGDGAKLHKALLFGRYRKTPSIVRNRATAGFPHCNWWYHLTLAKSLLHDVFWPNNSHELSIPYWIIPWVFKVFIPSHGWFEKIPLSFDHLSRTPVYLI